MRIKKITLHPYEIPLTNDQIRFGMLIQLIDEKENSGWGDIAPLPKWSRETLEDSTKQLNHKTQEILHFDWDTQTFLKQLEKLQLFPSVTFGLESALFALLTPLSQCVVKTSALLMGTFQEILKQSTLRYKEGYTSAKLKVSNLSFKEAKELIDQLKDKFYLRIDVNRAWSTVDSLRFFSQFALDAFDFVEEPFQNPKDLLKFSHPLAVDESFPEDLSLKELEHLPTFKALIYKPTIQGGMLGCLPLYEWANKRGVSLVLSSSFESDLGLAQIACIAKKLSLLEPIGIGTYHFLKKHICAPSLQFSRSSLLTSSQVTLSK